MWWLFIAIVLLIFGGALLIHLLRKKRDELRLKGTWKYRLTHVRPEDRHALSVMRNQAMNWATCAVGETFGIENMHELEQKLFDSHFNSTAIETHVNVIKMSGHAFDEAVARMYHQDNFHTNREHAIAHLQDIQWQKSRLEHLGVKF